MHLTGRTDAVSSAEAEAMSRMWQVVAIVDEIEREIRKNVRANDARTKALDALALAAVNLCTAAVALLPSDLAQMLLRQIAG